MTVVHATIEIDAPATVVFNKVMDPYCLRDWVTIHRALGRVSGEAGVEGARMDQVLQIHGVSFTVHWTLESVRRPSEAEWIGRGPALSHARIHYALRGGVNEPTQFEYTNEFGAPGGPLGRLASRVVVGGTSEREAHHSLERLKSLIEAGKPPASD